MTKPAKVDKTTAIEFIDIPPDATPASDAAIEAAANAAMPPEMGDNEKPASFETYREKAREHGKNRARGDDSVALLAIDIADGAKAGLVDPRTTTEREKANLADTKDQIETLFEDYVEARGLLAIHERKGNSLDNKLSQLRKFAHMGKLTEVNGPDVLSDVVARYKSSYAKANKDQRKLMNDAFTCYYKAAMAQVDQPKEALSDEDIGKCILIQKKTKQSTVADAWEKIANAAKALTDGTKVLADGSKLEDKSVEGGKLAALIVAYAADMAALLKIAENEKENARLQFERAQRNGATEEIPTEA